MVILLFPTRAGEYTLARCLSDADVAALPRWLQAQALQERAASAA